MSRNIKLGLVIGGLIFFLAISHFLLGHTVEEVYLAKHPWEANKMAEEEALPPRGLDKLPEPAGPEAAPLKIEVYMMGGDACHMPTIEMVEKAQQMYPDQLRVIYHDTREPGVAEQAQMRKVACEVGLFLNGENTIKVPGRGKYGLLTFQGPPGHMGWGADDFYAAIEQVLESEGVEVAAIKQEADEAAPGQQPQPQQ